MNIGSIGAAMTHAAQSAHQAQQPPATAPAGGATDGDHDGSGTAAAASNGAANQGHAVNLTA